MGDDGAVGRRPNGDSDVAVQTAQERQQALEYLHKVATSNAPEKDTAEEDLRYLKKREGKDV